MSGLPEVYVCRCQVPNPVMHLGEDSGLCKACGMVYDARLYEMRLRQHTAGYDYASLNEFLAERDPQYRRVTA